MMKKPRHMDFQRIYDEFCYYYHDEWKGEAEYYDWLHAINQDETQPYGQAREEFRWAKDMINLLREDKDNKYYKILVGFPITSMNGNVYKERDHIASALSLKGKHPSLNHKDEYHFTENSQWGPIRIIDGKYEDGAIEAIMQVPKTTRCPICNGAPMTELLDNKRIVNVSLEGNCASGFGGVCDGFEFRSDPPFTLLTVETLPGIPLARIKPLESIMVEALHANDTKPPLKENKKVKKIEAKIIEASQGSTSSTVYQYTPNVNTNTLTDPDFKGNPTGPTLQDNQLHTQVDNAKTVMGTPAYADNTKLTSGDPMTDKMVGSNTGPIEAAIKKGFLKVGEPCSPELKSCVDQLIADGKPEDSAWAICKAKVGEANEPKFPYDYEGGPTTDTSVPVPDNREGPGKTKPASYANLKLPEGAPASLPSPTGLHVNVPMGTSPIESLPSLEERVARIKAEMHAKSVEEQAAVWQQKHNEVYEKLTAKEGQYEGLKVAFDKLNERCINAEHDSQDATSKYNSQCGLVTDLKANLDKTVKDREQTNENYRKMIDKTIELDQKLTKINEDYLELHRQKEELEGKLQEARDKAKKIVRIKA